MQTGIQTECLTQIQWESLQMNKNDISLLQNKPIFLTGFGILFCTVHSVTGFVPLYSTGFIGGGGGAFCTPLQYGTGFIGGGGGEHFR